MSHYVYRNMHATKISKLQQLLISLALYVVYIWLIVYSF